MANTDRTAIVVSRSSMLGICVADGCTTIVFGRGTCVEHDSAAATVAGDLLVEVAEASRRAEEPVRRGGEDRSAVEG